MVHRFVGRLAFVWLFSAFSSFAAPGDLDPAFGTAGVARWPAGSAGTPSVLGSGRQADGKALVAGEVHGTTGTTYAFVARVNADGTMDASFGSGGLVMLAGATKATAVAPTPDGKVLVGVLFDNETKAGMARLNADGTRDMMACCNPDDFVWAWNASFRRIVAIAQGPEDRIYWASVSTDPYAYEATFSSVHRFYQGYVDGAYGNGGRANFELGDGSESLRAMLVQPDGSVIVGGWSSTSYSSYDVMGRDAVVARLDANGALDPAFGTGGRVIVDFNGGADEVAALAMDPQQRVVAVGKAGYSFGYYGEAQFGLLRLNAATGALDPAFGTGGKQQVPVVYDDYAQGHESIATAVVFLSSGELLLAGYTRIASYSNPVSRSVLLRLDPDGQAGVASFGYQGIVLSDRWSNMSEQFMGLGVSGGTLLGVGTRAFNGYPPALPTLHRQRVVEASGALDGDALEAALFVPSSSLSLVSALGPQGRIAVAGEQAGFGRVYGRLADGSQGAYLGYLGGNQYSGYADFQISNYPTRARAVAFTPEARILVGSLYGEAYEASKWAVSRFEETRGFPDYSWGSQGHAAVTALQDGDIAALAVAGDGKVVAAGYAKNPYVRSFALARFTPGGTLDPTFNGGGVLQLAASSYDEFGTALALQSDGGILVAGYAQYPTQMKVARVTQSGALDAAWGSAGIALSSIPGGAAAHALALQGQKVIVAGECFQYSYQGTGCAIRLNADGSVDSTFGNGGIADVPPVLGTSVITGVNVMGDRIVAAGESQGGYPFIVRWLADGALDTTFQGGGYTTSGPTADNWTVVVEANGRTLLTGVAGTAGGPEAVLVRYQGDMTDTTPDAFTFVDVSNAHVDQTVVSNPIVVTGINDATPISVVGGFYSINCVGTNMTSAPGLVFPGQSVCAVQLTASSGNTATDTTITIGGVSDTFTSVTGTQPDTSITGTPPEASASRSATFSFASTDPSAYFMCSLDSPNAAGACSSPVTYNALADGSHTFSVYSINAIGGDASPATFTWTIDGTAPETSIGSGPATPTNQTSATFTFSGTDYGGYGSGLTFECAFDGAAFAGCTSPTTISGVGNGPHTFQVRAIDPLGNVDATPASHSWMVDLVAPSTSISGPTITNAASSTFTFTSDDPAATFECDGTGSGTSFYPCPNPLVSDNTLFADGTYTFLVRAKDSVGNVDATPASWTFTIDRAAPDTSLNYAPTGVTNATTASASFFSSEGGSTFECRLDGAAYAPCTSPVAYSNLAEGSHSIDIRAKDAAGNFDATPASSSWTIDRTAPDTTLASGPSGTVAQSSGSFGFASPDVGATFQCSIDSGAWFGCASPYPFYDLADGTHLFEVRAVDAADNFDPSPASRTWTIDTAAPNTTIGSGPQAVTPFPAASFQFTSPDGVSFMCSLDGGPYAACASPANYAGLAGGAHGFAVYAIDAAGNADASPATWSWAVDVTAPETTLVSGPSGTVAQSTAAFSFTSNDAAATFECRLDGAAFAPCTSPVNLSGLSSAAHVFDVRAKDAVGNVDATPASRSWTVDTIAPNTTITAQPANPANSSSASFSFSATEGGSTFECKLDAGAFAACTSPKAYSGLAAGSHSFQVRARDAAGNQDATPASYTWVVDLTAPNTTITGGPSGNNNSNSATFTFASTEAGTFECKLDAGAFAACTTPKAYTGLASGQHSFQVRARDTAGNLDASPANRSWGVR